MSVLARGGPHEPPRQTPPPLRAPYAIADPFGYHSTYSPLSSDVVGLETVVDPDAGKKVTSKHIILTPEEIDKMLREPASSLAVGRKGNPVIKVETLSIASNPRNEDRITVNMVPFGGARGKDLLGEGFWGKWAKLRDEIKLPAAPASGAPGVDSSADRGNSVKGHEDLNFFSVFDGHSKDVVSDLLSKTLHPWLALALAERGMVHGHMSEDEDLIKSIISDAYEAWDKDIHDSVLIPITTTEPPRPSFFALTETDSAGSCALTAVVDSQNSKIYVANLGDSRAIAGWYNPSTSMWRCDPLSEDHSAQNPAEVERLQSEHPPEEKDKVVASRGPVPCVLGKIMVSRAMGDSVFKRTSEAQNGINTAYNIKPKNVMTPEMTPPYLSSKPDVTVRPLVSRDSEELRYIVLASDGLWDHLTSEEVTLLMSPHLSHPSQAEIPKAQLPTKVVLTPPPEKRPYPAQPLPGTAGRDQGSWVFEDDNAATHLVRNAFGEGDKDLRQWLLSVRGPDARGQRDDTSVIVIHFEGGGETAKGSEKDTKKGAAKGQESTGSAPTAAKQGAAAGKEDGGPASASAVSDSVETSSAARDAVEAQPATHGAPEGSRAQISER